MRSPLDEADLTKDEIRLLSREAGLPTWDVPASACLSSRIPYGSEVTEDKLRTIERAEDGCCTSSDSACFASAITTRWRVSNGQGRDAARARSRRRCDDRARTACRSAISTSRSTCRAIGSAASTRRCACGPCHDRRPARSCRWLAGARPWPSRAGLRARAPAVHRFQPRRHRLGQLRARGCATSTSRRIGRTRRAIPLYIALGKLSAAIVQPLSGDVPRSAIEARALSMLSLIGAVVAMVALYLTLACWSRAPDADGSERHALGARSTRGRLRRPR